MNADLGFSASEDAVLDALFEKAEKEIVSSEKNLIGVCATFLSKLCRNLGLMQEVILFWDLIFSGSSFLALGVRYRVNNQAFGYP